MQYFEDLEVGDTFDAGTYTITRAEIISFAEQFDPLPIHVDEEAAAESMFGGLIASGLHTMCLAHRLFVTEFVRGSDGIALIGGRGMDDVRLHAPVYPDDTLHMTIEVTGTEASSSREDQGYVDFERLVHTDDGLVLSYVTDSIVARAAGDP